MIGADQGFWRLILAAMLLLATQACTDEAHLEQSSKVVHEFDFGRVSLDNGSVTLEHEFIVTNNSTVPVEIPKVWKSCGCLAADLGDDHLEPGDTTFLRLVLEVTNPGRKAEGATVVLSNGERIEFQVLAFGTLSVEFTPILLSASIDRETRRMDLRLFFVDSNGKGETDAPSVVKPDGVSLEFAGWSTLEEQTAQQLRPTRQVGNAVLDFTLYRGEFPVEVELESASGVTCSLIVAPPS